MKCLKKIILRLITCIYYSTVAVIAQNEEDGCQIPHVVRGSWFSWENGRSTLTEINADSMTGRGICINMLDAYHVNYTFVFRDLKTATINNTCYHCVKIIVRTVNILEKLEGK